MDKNIEIVSKDRFRLCTCTTWPHSPHPDLSSEIKHYLQNEEASLGAIVC